MPTPPARGGLPSAGRPALVHEWLSRAGGSENVFAVLADMYPAADLICLWNDDPDRFSPSRTRETWLARTPLRRHKAAALPLMMPTWRHLPYGPYEWALISTHAFAHHARFAGPAPVERFVYVHSPARYVWTPTIDGRGASLPARISSAALRPLDRRAALRGAHFAANSEFVRLRMETAWGVQAAVIHPPVEVAAIQAVPDWAAVLTPAEREQLEGLPDAFVLGASRFVPYKRLDLVIETAAALDLPVVLAGAGPGEQDLRRRVEEAGVPGSFVLSPSDAMLRALYARTTLYVFPALEDFGIMPVEALAAGAPVLALDAGGTAETVRPGVTGALTDFSNPLAVREAAYLAIGTDRAVRRSDAARFSRERFERAIQGWTGR